MKYIKENWKVLLFFAICGLIGGIFTGFYLLETYSEDILNEIVNQIGNKYLLIVVSTLQSVIYALILGSIGIVLSNKIGLWKNFKTEKKGLTKSIIVSIIGGLSLILFDVLLFSNYIESVKQLYEVKPSISYILSSFFYGGVIEEVMIRLFLMSLLSLIIYKVFFKKSKNIPTIVFIISNVVTALLFAAGHLTTTFAMMGQLTPMILVRCFLLNGGLGLLFGWLYRKYGIKYSIIAHIGTHLISKLIWVLFI